MKRTIVAGAALVTLLTVSVSSFAAQDAHDHGAPAEHIDGEPAAGHDAHAKGHGAHHVPSFHDINWYHGLLFERDGVEPGLLARPTGMPVPFLSYALNALALYFILYRFAKKPVTEGLARRKASIERGMKDAAETKASAQTRLAHYEKKLASIEEEIERVRRDMRHAGEVERARILADARARRERMEKDAKLLVEQEFAAARETLLRETVQSALKSASDALKARVTPSDHSRLADEYLAGLPNMKGLSRATRSSA